MTSPEENPTDDELADLMSEHEGGEEITDNDAGVEVGIPPSVEGDDSEVSTEEERFSMNDFDSELAPTSSVSNMPDAMSCLLYTSDAADE